LLLLLLTLLVGAVPAARCTSSVHIGTSEQPSPVCSATLWMLLPILCDDGQHDDFSWPGTAPLQSLS
jgi:hypothetical protein